MKFLIWSEESHMWLCEPNSLTHSLAKAGRYSLEEARELCRQKPSDDRAPRWRIMLDPDNVAAFTELLIEIDRVTDLIMGRTVERGPSWSDFHKRHGFKKQGEYGRPMMFDLTHVGPFDKAFAQARSMGLESFTWMGKEYHTRIEGEPDERR